MGRLFENACEKTKEGRRLAALLFSIGVIQIAAYYFSGAMVNGADSMAIAQPDSLLYMQAARRIVDARNDEIRLTSFPLRKPATDVGTAPAWIN